MKRTVMNVLAGVCTVSMAALSLAACGSGTSTPAATSAASFVETSSSSTLAETQAVGVNSMLATEPITLRFASSGSGTSDYTDIGTIIAFLSEDGRIPKGSTLTQETVANGTASSGYLIEAGIADICRGQNSIAATEGFNGRPPYSTVNALFAAGGNSCFLQVSSEMFQKKSGYSTIEEVIENKYPARICSEDVGSTDYVLLNDIFKIHGIDAETYESWGGTITYTSNDTASEMMQDGSCDLICMATTLTSSTITELTMSADVSVNGFRQDTVDGLIKMGFTPRTIPAGTFDQFPEDAPSAYSGTSLIVSKDVDEKVAYTLTKVLLENMDTLAEICPTFKNMTIESAADTGITVVPLHPGSVKYFQEIGILDENGNLKS